jgi:alpha-D-ribose 1-methylphosphonate 5-triphosphate synthase subunit PhnL
MLVQIQQVAKRFTLHNRNGMELPVLARVNLNVAKGECVVLDGPSGMGKSTLLKLIYANYRASAGTITIDRGNGQIIDVTKANPRQLIEMRRETVSYVSQFLRVIPRISALDVVADALVEDALLSQDPSKEKLAFALNRAREMLARLAIPERLWQLPPATFSGGEQQRINIARNLIKPRSVLLLDEPTASLDEVNSQTVVTLIKEAIERGAAVIGIFHDQKVGDAVATRRVDMTKFRSAL